MPGLNQRCGTCAYANPIYGAPVPGQVTQFRCQRSTPETWVIVFDTDFCGFWAPGSAPIIGPPSAQAGCEGCTHSVERVSMGVGGSQEVVGMRCQRQLPLQWRDVLPNDWCGEFLLTNPPVSIIVANLYLVSGTIFIPAAVTDCIVELVGGGAGAAAGGAGGTGSYCRRAFTGLMGGLTLNLVIGSGGAVGSNDGGDTVLSSGTFTLPVVLTAGGGKASGAGGVATNGNINVVGGPGWNQSAGGTGYANGGNPLCAARMSGVSAFGDVAGNLYGGGAASATGGAGAAGGQGVAFIEWFRSYS